MKSIVYGQVHRSNIIYRNLTSPIELFLSLLLPLIGVLSSMSLRPSSSENDCSESTLLSSDDEMSNWLVPAMLIARSKNLLWLAWTTEIVGTINDKLKKNQITHNLLISDNHNGLPMTGMRHHYTWGLENIRGRSHKMFGLNHTAYTIIMRPQNSRWSTMKYFLTSSASSRRRS